MRPEYQLIVQASTEKDYVKMRKLYQDLVIERMRLDKFFTMYLDKFERKMDSENTNTPIWDLYKKKTKEYAELTQSIRAAEYYLRKP